jgi:hypothetical protein
MCDAERCSERRQACRAMDAGSRARLDATVTGGVRHACLPAGRTRGSMTRVVDDQVRDDERVVISSTTARMTSAAVVTDL